MRSRIFSINCRMFTILQRCCMTSYWGHKRAIHFRPAMKLCDGAMTFFGMETHFPLNTKRVPMHMVWAEFHLTCFERILKKWKILNWTCRENIGRISGILVHNTFSILQSIWVINPISLAQLFSHGKTWPLSVMQSLPKSSTCHITYPYFGRYSIDNDSSSSFLIISIRQFDFRFAPIQCEHVSDTYYEK